MGLKTIPISISLAGSPSTRGRATVLDRPLHNRLARAGVSLLALWAIAAVCLVIPVAHFVRVPAFEMAGVSRAAR